MTALKHLAAFVSCHVAGAAGLAPSVTGHPGYWPRHDPDDDGLACE
jgi:hypothetical protein